ncbi:helix-turn-helix domain-containing protein [bacterium]|nr:helix-turn-helix domain-containing protein [bacterium]
MPLTLQERVARFVDLLLRETGETQEGLAKIIGITPAALRRYRLAISLPSLETMLEISELGNVSINDILRKDDVLVKILASKADSAQEKDRVIEHALTPRQVEKLKDLVDQIVQVHKQTSEKPQTYGAVWGLLCRKLGVKDYSEITQEEFPIAEAYLIQTLLRLQRSGGVEGAHQDPREQQYRTIYSLARRNLGWTRSSTNGFVTAKFQKESIRELSPKELDDLFKLVSEREISRRKHGKKKR